MIMDCYKLAKHYAVDPDVFLNKPLSEIQKHLYWTGQVIKSQRPVDEE